MKDVVTQYYPVVIARIEAEIDLHEAQQALEAAEDKGKKGGMPDF